MSVRKVKFRGRRLDNVWVEGYYCVWQNRHYIAPAPHESGFNGGEIISYEIAGFFQVDPATVGMFTGLHDKNGVEIYGAVGEKGGDIVTRHEKGDSRIVDDGFVIIGEVVYEAPDFVIRKNKQWSAGLVGDNLEVIGTVHEHPELLTQTVGR